MIKRILILLACVLVAMPAFAQTSKTGTLTWDAVTMNADGTPASDLKGYKIYGDSLLCSQAGPKQFIAEVGKVQTFTHTVPATAFQYSYNITAIDTSGNESTRSNCAEKTFYVAPSAGVVTVGTLTTTSIALTLGAVSDGAGGNAKYDVRWAVAPALTNGGWGTATSVATCVNPGSCTITGLTPGTRYEIQAVTYRGTLNAGAVFGPVTAIVAADTLKDAVLPAAPENLKVVERPTPDSVILGWEQPGGDPDQHRVDRLHQANGRWIPVAYTAGFEREAQAWLPNKGRRMFRVCAIEGGRDICNNSNGLWVTR